MKTPLMVLAALALGAGCLDPGEPGNLVPRTVTEDPMLPQIQVNGTRLHAEAFGAPAAPTVIALHGGPGGDYRSMLGLRALADDGYRVVFWDNRGAGLSQRHDASTYTMTLYLQDLRQVVDTMTAPGKPYVLIGHSWGAMYASWFINEYGDYGGRLRGAILSDPGGFNTAELRAFIDRYMASYKLTGELINDAFWSDQFLSATDHERADYLRGMMPLAGIPAEADNPAHRPPFWRAGAVVSSALFDLVDKEGFDWTTNLHKFQHKVLFLRSSRDTAHTLESQQEQAAHYPDADIITMPNVGHAMIWERPAEYLSYTRDYFRAIGFVGGAQ